MLNKKSELSLAFFLLHSALTYVPSETALKIEKRMKTFQLGSKIIVEDQEMALEADDVIVIRTNINKMMRQGNPILSFGSPKTAVNLAGRRTMLGVMALEANHS